MSWVCMMGRSTGSRGSPGSSSPKGGCRKSTWCTGRCPVSDPACYEFLWGPRAHAETSKLKALKFLVRVNARDPSSFPSLSEGTEIDEEEGA